MNNTTKKQKEMYANLIKNVKSAIKEVIVSLKNFDENYIGGIRFTVDGFVQGWIYIKDESKIFQIKVYGKHTSGDYMTTYHFPVERKSLSEQVKKFKLEFEPEFKTNLDRTLKANHLVNYKKNIEQLNYDLKTLTEILNTSVESCRPERFDIQKKIFSKHKEIEQLKKFEKDLVEELKIKPVED